MAYDAEKTLSLVLFPPIAFAQTNKQKNLVWFTNHPAIDPSFFFSEVGEDSECDC